LLKLVPAEASKSDYALHRLIRVLGLEKTFSVGDGHCLGSRSHPKLGKDVLDVRTDRLGTDEQQPCGPFGSTQLLIVFPLTSSQTSPVPLDPCGRANFGRGFPSRLHEAPRG
jgi:hypothetical protein